jgi:probable rRNA maturation factor
MIGRKGYPIKFYFISSPFYFSKRKELKAFLLYLFKKEGHKVEAVNYIFCTDDYLLELNQHFLNHNTYTDIITFELSEREAPIVADIYISVERVRENSHLFQSSFAEELHRVIFHGALHLCGYRDKSAKDIKKMRFKEDYYINRYLVSREKRASKS